MQKVTANTPDKSRVPITLQAPLSIFLAPGVHLRKLECIVRFINFFFPSNLPASLRLLTCYFLVDARTSRGDSPSGTADGQDVNRF